MEDHMKKIGIGIGIVLLVVTQMAFAEPGSSSSQAAAGEQKTAVAHEIVSRVGEVSDPEARLGTWWMYAVIALLGVGLFAFIISRSKITGEDGKKVFAYTLTAKVVTGFGVLILLLAFISVFSLNQMASVGEKIAEIDELDIHIIEKVSTIEAHQMQQAIIMERAIRHGVRDDRNADEEFAGLTSQFEEMAVTVDAELEEAIDYLLHIPVHSVEEADYIRELIAKFEKIEAEHMEWDSHALDVFADIRTGVDTHTEEFEGRLDEIAHEADDIDHEMEAFLLDIEHKTEETIMALEQQEQSTIVLVLVLAAVSLAIGLLLAIYIIADTSRQLGGDPRELSTVAQKVANGELDIDAADSGTRHGVYQRFMEMVGALKIKGEALQEIAEGNLTVDVNLASKNDSLGISMESMVESLNDLLAQVNAAVEQVSSGSSQVSQSSQSLSQGAAEQASSLEEITSSLAEINSQSTRNAENATEANALAKAAMESAESGNAQMSNLMEAMDKINTSADETKKVVKVIDDIAFQINLLALNANVEAARAGKYGKGFAVVADEVRNLAVRSAEAVKETTEMVEISTSNIDEGTKAAELTAGQLEEILTGSAKVAEFLGEIALASKEQAQGVQQINGGLEQIDQVTQSNTASAEEGASAAEELAAQATQLQGMVSRFKLKNGHIAAQEVRRVETAAPVAVAVGAQVVPGNGNGSGNGNGHHKLPSEVISLDDDFGDF